MSVQSPEWHALNLKYLDGQTLCAYGCGRVATTGDHVIPRSRGGEDTEDNYAPSCRTCNSRKGSGPPPRSVYYSTTYQEMKARHERDSG